MDLRVEAAYGGGLRDDLVDEAGAGDLGRQLAARAGDGQRGDFGRRVARQDVVDALGQGLHGLALMPNIVVLDDVVVVAQEDQVHADGAQVGAQMHTMLLQGDGRGELMRAFINAAPVPQYYVFAYRSASGPCGPRQE